MVFLVTIITSGPAQVPIFPMRWLVAAKIILSQDLGCVYPNGRGKALTFGAAGAAIATILIMPTLLMVLARSLQGFSLLGTIRRYSLGVL